MDKISETSNQPDSMGKTLVYSQNYTIITVYNAVPLPPLQNQWMQKESRPTHPIR